MAIAGTLMAAWSVLVDKVHRNPSTGIDWDRGRPLTATLHVSGTKLAGLWATWALIGFLYCLGRWYWDGQYLFAMHMIGWAALPMFVLSVPYRPMAWLSRRSPASLAGPSRGAWRCNPRNDQSGVGSPAS